MGRITTEFPQYHIMGVVHATIRWMRRRHQVNDLMDHQHATAALPYCNAFFTERDMRDTLTRGPFNLDRVYGCCVISDPNEAMKYLDGVTTTNGEYEVRAGDKGSGAFTERGTSRDRTK